MHTLGEELNYSENWTPLSINLKLVKDILNECVTKHDIQDAGEADSMAKRILIVADSLSDDLTKTNMYYVAIRSRAKDRFNDVKQSAIDEKSDAGKERIALCDVAFRSLRDEYKKAELLVTHLQIKYRELLSYHYSFKDTSRRLSGLKFATASGSDSEAPNQFNIPLPGAEQKKETDSF